MFFTFNHLLVNKKTPDLFIFPIITYLVNWFANLNSNVLKSKFRDFFFLCGIEKFKFFVLEGGLVFPWNVCRKRYITYFHERRFFTKLLLLYFFSSGSVKICWLFSITLNECSLLKCMSTRLSTARPRRQLKPLSPLKNLSV